MSIHLVKAKQLLEKGKLDDAARLYNKALKQDPKNPAISYILGELLLRLGRVDESLPHLQLAIGSDSRQPCWYATCGEAFMQKTMYTDAEKALRAAEMLGCRSEKLYFQWADYHFLVTRDYELSEDYFQKAISVNPTSYESYIGLSRLYDAQERYDKSLQALEYCLQNGYATSAVYANLGKALSHQGRQNEALECYRESLRIEPESRKIQSNYIMQLLYVLDDQVDIHLEVKRIVRKANKGCKKRFYGKIDRNPERKLRLGFVSADLHFHAIAFYISPILERISKERFTLYVYYNNVVVDEVTARIKSSVDHWRECKHLSDAQFESTVKQDEVDILIDLSNHTADNRLGVFAGRPAPLQIAWMGVPVSTGLDSFDYWLRDAQIEALPNADSWSSEALLPVENLLVFDYLHGLPDIAPAPIEANGYITFGSMNGLRKVGPDMIDRWAQLLHRVPDSRIRMLIEDFENPNMREHIYEKFAQHKVPKERVILQGRTSMQDFLQSHNEIDIALDSYPYNGQTTTFHALAMGVPVVSCKGRSIASCLSSWILSKIGRLDWVASDLDEYVDIAQKLAADVEAIKRARQLLRGQLMQSPLIDYNLTVTNLESALQRLWRDFVNQSSAKS